MTGPVRDPVPAAPLYALELNANGRLTVVEPLVAWCDEDAIELANLRLLLGPDHDTVKVWTQDRLVHTLSRDSLRRSPLAAP